MDEFKQLLWWLYISLRTSLIFRFPHHFWDFSGTTFATPKPINKTHQCQLPSLLVSVVLHNPDGAIGLVQAVHALHDVTVAGLVLGLLVAGVRVLHFVRELVFGVGLWKKVIVNSNG